MTISSASYVSCDNCGDPAPVVTDGARIARAVARGEGYSRERVDGRMVDLCPACTGAKELTGERVRRWDYGRRIDPTTLSA